MQRMLLLSSRAKGDCWIQGNVADYLEQFASGTNGKEASKVTDGLLLLILEMQRL